MSSSARIVAWSLAVSLAFAGTVVPSLAETLTASGEWRSLSSEVIKGTWSASLSREGENLGGEITVKGSNVFTGGGVEGRITESTITFGVVSQGGKQATFDGLIDGTSIKGEWQSDAVGDHGVWFGTAEEKKR